MAIVRVVGVVRGSERSDRRWPGVIGVDGAGVILEGLVMGRVVGLGAGDGGHGRTAAPGGAVGIGDVEVEAALKPAPGELGGVEQVADVLAGHADRRGRAGADVAGWIGVANNGQAAVPIGDDPAAGIDGVEDAVGLARDDGEGSVSGLYE